MIAIISLLSSVIFNVSSSAREKGRKAKTLAELTNIRSATALLVQDTGKLPNGCPPGMVVDTLNNEIKIDATNAGIIERPTQGDTVYDVNNGNILLCRWTASEVAAWNGPYMQEVTDPWGSSYWFDNDYKARLDPDTGETCSPPTPNVIIAVVSLGPDRGADGEFGVGELSNDDYDCNDIYVELY